MDNIDFTEGLCGWNSDQNQNDENSTTISHEMELRNMFNELKILNHPKKISNQNNHHQRPKSSSLINTRRRSQEQTAAKTARTLSKPNSNRSSTTPTPKHRSSESNHSKSSKKALIKAYLPQSYNRKKLQRSHSNLYIRDPTKTKKNNDISTTLNKKQKARQLNLELNLDPVITVNNNDNNSNDNDNNNNNKDNNDYNNIEDDIDDNNNDNDILTEQQCVSFSEALFRSKFPETANETNVIKSKNMKSKRHRKMKNESKQHRLDRLSKEELSLNPEKFSKVLMTVNDYYKQQQLNNNNTPFLTPSTSMVSLHENRYKNIKTQKKNNNNTISEAVPLNRRKTRRKARTIKTKTSAIPIKCFNSEVLTTHKPKINTFRQSRINNGRLSGSGSKDKDKNAIRSQSVDLKDNNNNNTEDEEFSIGDIEKYHHKMIRNKENVYPITDRKYRRKNDDNTSLEQKLKHVIARWESHEKVKTRRTNRSQRSVRSFK